MVFLRIFPTRSPAFPGNPSPVGFPIQIRDDAVEGFAAVSLSLPAAPTTAAPAAAAAIELKVAVTVAGFINDSPVFFNPYSRFLLPLKQQQQEEQQQQTLSLPGATRGAADVLLRIHPKLSELPDGLLLVQIERQDPHYSSTGSSHSKRLVHVATIATGSRQQQQQQQPQQQQQLNRVLLQTDEEVRTNLKVSVSRLLGQKVFAIWLPAAAAAATAVAAAQTAAAAAAAATPEVHAGRAPSAAAPLAGSQHVPLLSDQVNEDFNRFLLHRGAPQASRRERGPFSGATLVSIAPLFFPYTRSFQCIFSPSLLLPEAPPSALGVPSRKRWVTEGRPPRGMEAQHEAPKGPSLNGKIEITSVWTKAHYGVTSLTGEFTTDVETELPLLVQVEQTLNSR